MLEISPGSASLLELTSEGARLLFLNHTGQGLRDRCSSVGYAH
jgi:hypothetical protein